METCGLDTPIVRFIWTRCLRRDWIAEPNIRATWRRFAQALAAVEWAKQVALQTHVDQAIAKTINLQPDVRFDAFARCHRQVREHGLKGRNAFPATEAGWVIITTSNTTNLLELVRHE